MKKQMDVKNLILSWRYRQGRVWWWSKLRTSTTQVQPPTPRRDAAATEELDLGAAVEGAVPFSVTRCFRRGSGDNSPSLSPCEACSGLPASLGNPWSRCDIDQLPSSFCAGLLLRTPTHMSTQPEVFLPTVAYTRASQHRLAQIDL